MPKILKWTERFEKYGKNANLIKPFRTIINDRITTEHNDQSLWTDIDRDVFKVFFENFIVNTSLAASNQQVKSRQKHGCNIPWAILMDLTSACNLKCMMLGGRLWSKAEPEV